MSKGAVWAALSGNNTSVRMAPTTRERILKAARKLKYTPNLMAKGINVRKSFLLGFCFSEYNWHVASQLIRHIQDCCISREYSLVVYPAGKLQEERDNLGLGVRRQLDGIITIPFLSAEGHNAVTYANLARDFLPVTQVIFPLCPGLPFVGRDYRRIGYEATALLLRQGHRRIGFLTHPNYRDSVHGSGSYLCHQGYADAMTEAGGEPEAHVHEINTVLSTTDHGYAIAARLLDEGDLPTALVASSNGLAYGAMARLREAGICIPADVSVVGCGDDIALPSCLAPALTHFPVAFAEIAKTSVDLCLQPPEDGQQATFCPESSLLPGETVAPPRK